MMVFAAGSIFDPMLFFRAPVSTGTIVFASRSMSRALFRMDFETRIPAPIGARRRSAASAATSWPARK